MIVEGEMFLGKWVLARRLREEVEKRQALVWGERIYNYTWTLEKG
jgi:hypothetical protein